MKTSPRPEAADPLAVAAGQWLARRDRGLTPAEQDEYLQWLRQDPRHGQAISRFEKTWGALDVLTQWKPAHSATPNPDLLALRQPSRLYWLATAFAAAAAVAMAGYFWIPGSARNQPAAPRREAIIHPRPERQELADGSVVELNQGARIEVHFTPAERRVRLVAGEAHFSVAKNPDRPFFVDTDKVTVRAVGTAFNVTLAQTEVAVLVTEGKVQVLEHAPLDSIGPPKFARLIHRRPIVLLCGQRTVVRLDTEPALPAASPGTAGPAAPVVQDVTPAEIERALSWQGIRLEFVDMPLGDVVAEFNRFNRQHLVVRDGDTAAIIVGGNFRADNVEGFVRLLEAGFGVRAEPQGGGVILLRRATH